MFSPFCRSNLADIFCIACILWHKFRLNIKIYENIYFFISTYCFHKLTLILFWIIQFFVGVTNDNENSFWRSKYIFKVQNLYHVIIGFMNCPQYETEAISQSAQVVICSFFTDHAVLWPYSNLSCFLLNSILSNCLINMLFICCSI